MTLFEKKSAFQSFSFHTAIKILVCAGLLVYVGLRAYHLSFTHDEGTSFKIIQGQPVWDTTANNHLLNTVLMSRCSKWFGNSEFSLRLPNVFAFVIFGLGAFLITRTIKNKWVGLFGLIAVLCNTYVLEFFALARGYGLSLGFMMMSLYFLVRSSQSQESIFVRDFALSMLFASLSIYASLTLINYYIALLVLFVFRFVLLTRKQNLRSRLKWQFWSLTLVSLIPLILAMNRLLGLKSRNELYFGAPSFFKGFDALTFSALAQSSFVLKIVLVLKVLTVFSVAGAILLVFAKKLYTSALAQMLLLVGLLLGGIFFEGIVLGASYPSRRTALFYAPIVGVFIAFLFQTFLQFYPKASKMLASVTILLGGFIVWNLTYSVNLKTATDWPYDANTKKVMLMVKEKAEQSDRPLIMSNHWTFEPTINYYITTWELKIEAVTRDPIRLDSDVVYQKEGDPELPGFEMITKFHYGGEYWVRTQDQE
ncbi:MAG: glycosyltransferase family 39 protein [Bacteroidota bacterium]